MKLKRFYWKDGKVDMPENWNVYSMKERSFPFFWRTYAVGVDYEYEEAYEYKGEPSLTYDPSHGEDEPESEPHYGSLGLGTPYIEPTFSLPESTPDDGFSDGSCFMDSSDDEDDMRYCDICTQFVGLSHNHIGETILEKDTSEWANSIHRKCEICGHEAEIWPTGSGSYGSQLDYCNKTENGEYICEKPWGMGQDHDRWAEDYTEHDSSPSQPVLVCSACGMYTTDFGGTKDCEKTGDFHPWVFAEAVETVVTGPEIGDVITITELEELIQEVEEVISAIDEVEELVKTTKTPEEEAIARQANAEAYATQYAPRIVGLRGKPVEEEAVAAPKPSQKGKTRGPYNTKAKKLAQEQLEAVAVATREEKIADPIEPQDWYGFEMDNPIEPEKIKPSEYVKVGKGQYRTKEEVEADPILAEAARQYLG